MSTLWGIPYLFIKLGIDGGLTPAMVAWGRVLLAAGVLLALAMRAGTLGQLRGRMRWLIAYAVLEIAIPFPLIAAGETRIASSLTAIIIASVPLIVALLAIRFDQEERATGTRLLGLVIGLAGVVVLVGIDIAGKPSELVGAIAVLLAAVGYAIGPMIYKRTMTDVDPRAAMGGSLALAALILTPVALLDAPAHAPSAGAIASVGVLGLLCTALAFSLFALLIAEIGPGRALVVAYINPIVAVALGVAILGERPGAGAVAGLLLILAGSWLSTDGRLPPGLAQRLPRGRRQAAAVTVEADVDFVLPSSM
jgi:drug/metabolite transporter (DMT)-like permease